MELKELFNQRKELREMLDSYKVQLERQQEALKRHYNLAEAGKENLIGEIQAKLDKLALKNRRTKNALEATEDQIAISTANNVENLQKLIDNKKPKKKNNQSKNKYSQRQIGIAYSLINEPITTDNYEDILKKYSHTTSKKILQKRDYTTRELTTPSGNRTTDSKHLKDLLVVKRLLNQMNTKKDISSIDSIITAFRTSFEATY
jgi:hypothetical protein